MINKVLISVAPVSAADKHIDPKKNSKRCN